MLVIPEKKKIVIDSSANDDVLTCIPHAKKLTLNGKNMVALNYGVEESLVLKNMGFSVPAPILHYYAWPGRFAPMDHQKDTAAFMTMHKRALVLNAPGTGKSISALWAADFLLDQGVAKKVLVIAPLSTLTVVWGRELKHHLPHRSFGICTGSKEKRMRVLETPGVQYVIINHDGFSNMQSHLTDFDVVIYDEATALKSPSSQRYKIFAKWMEKHQPWLWLLTGTPISQTPADAWTLARLCASPYVPKSFTTFKDMVMQKVTTFRWTPRPDALETCRRVLQPSIRFSLDECKDLPDTNFVGRKTELTKQQEKAFKEMKDKAVTVFAAGEVAAPNAAVVLSKMLQICCGTVIGETSTIDLDDSERYNTLTELLGEIGDKVIVFLPFKATQQRLLDRLTAAGYDAALVNGDTSKNDRNQIFNDFQHTDNIKVLLAHPKVAAHGLTLTRAKDIIWFAPIYSLEQYEQANARIRRLTTQGKTTVWHLWATSFEAELYRRLRAKKNTLAEFLALVQGVNSDDE